MREHLRAALQRKRAAAEQAGETDRVASIDARLTEAEKAPAEKGTESETESDLSVDLTAAARQKADELGLTAADFRRRRPGGKTGFTVEDVERIAEARDRATPTEKEKS